jgi:hypothetical protein
MASGCEVSMRGMLKPFAQSAAKRAGRRGLCSSSSPASLERRSAAVAVRQGVRHSLRWGGRPLDVWDADWPGALGRTELDAVDLDVVALTGALEHVVEHAASVAERVGPVGKDDSRLELHTRSIAWPGLDPRPLLASLLGRLGEPLATRIEIHTRRRSRRPALPWHLLFARSASPGRCPSSSPTGFMCLCNG